MTRTTAGVREARRPSPTAAIPATVARCACYVRCPEQNGLRRQARSPPCRRRRRGRSPPQRCPRRRHRHRPRSSGMPRGGDVPRCGGHVAQAVDGCHHPGYLVGGRRCGCAARCGRRWDVSPNARYPSVPRLAGGQKRAAVRLLRASTRRADGYQRGHGYAPGADAGAVNDVLHVFAHGSHRHHQRRRDLRIAGSLAASFSPSNPVTAPSMYWALMNRRRRWFTSENPISSQGISRSRTVSSVHGTAGPSRSAVISSTASIRFHRSGS